MSRGGRGSGRFLRGRDRPLLPAAATRRKIADYTLDLLARFASLEEQATLPALA